MNRQRNGNRRKIFYGQKDPQISKISSRAILRRVVVCVTALVILQFSVLPAKPSPGLPSVVQDALQPFAFHSTDESAVNNLRNGTLGPFCLVHVGKTAGGTLSCQFGEWLAKSCPKQSKVSSRLRQHVLGKFHKARDWGCLKRKRLPAVWLFTLRHPLDRIVSWFYYEHPNFNLVNEIAGNRPYLYKDCYDSLDDLSQIGLHLAWRENRTAWFRNDSSSSDRRFSAACAKRAWDAVAGRVGYQYHNYYNYGYYKNWVDKVMKSTNYTILVIRSEHLEEDWTRLEMLYGGVPRFSSTEKRSRDDLFSTMRRHNSNSSVNIESYPNLCLALCREIKVYVTLLSRAINLTPKQLRASLSELEAKCPLLPTCKQPPILQFQDSARMIDVPGLRTDL